MRHTLFIAAALAMTLAASSAAFAQHEDRDERGFSRDRHEHMREDHHGHRDEDRGAGPRHDIHRGERLPRDFEGRYYIVDDWRSHRLSAPPRGYHWVQVGGDYVLVSNRNSVVTQIVIIR